MKFDMESSAMKLIDGDANGVPASVTDEELFCDYLEARIQQALDTLNAAREHMMAKPDDFNRAIVVMRRVYELRDMKKQLEHQRTRVDAAREAAGLGKAEPATVGTATPTSEFRAAQAEQAAKVMAALAAKPKTCNFCQAPILEGNAECGCRQVATVTSNSTVGQRPESLS